ncbi:MAG: hypothetical protein HQL46_14990, partial [Gammaproteobacteria bacterium]|nr:hypothetical protein [Gammaproteobacteria bacterium]
KNMQDELTVVQKKWKPLIEDHYTQMHGKTKLYLSEDAEILQKICQFEVDDFDEDVVVYPGVGFRAFSYSDFRHIQLAPWIIGRMKLEKLGKIFESGQYNVVHLRGGSKTWAGGDGSGAEEYVKKINSTFPTLKSYLNFLWKQYSEQVLNQPEPLPLFILSDSSWLAEQCIKKFGTGKYLNISFAGPMVSSGVHMASAQELAKHNLTKIDINYESLRDFAIMCNAKTIIHDGISVYSKMANLVKAHINPSWRITASLQ